MSHPGIHTMDYLTHTSSMPLWGVIGIVVAVVVIIVLPILACIFYKIYRKWSRHESTLTTTTTTRHDDCDGRHRSRRRTTVCHLCRRVVSEENW